MPILHAPILEQAGFVAGNGKPVNYVYALKSSAYDYAALTTEVVLPEDGILSFYIYVVESSNLDYVFRSTTGSYIYYRQSDGRFRVVTDDGRIFTFNGLILGLNEPSKIMLIFTSSGVDLYINDVFYDDALGSHTTFTVGQIGEEITTFGVTIGSLASYPLLTDSASGSNPFDTIGSNNLTFINLKDPLNNDDYIEVIDND